MTQLLAIYPIGDEDTDALPVKTLDSAIAFYEKVFGCTLTDRRESRATLTRDAIHIGVIVDAQHDPARAGSVAIEVSDLEALHRELDSAGARPGAFGIDEWNGRSHRTFFVREDDNGYCYCFYNPLSPSAASTRES